MNPIFKPHGIAKPKVPKISAAPKPPQLATKLKALLGGNQRRGANPPGADPRNASTPHPDRAAIESMQLGGLGYIGRQPVIGMASDPNGFQP